MQVAATAVTGTVISFNGKKGWGFIRRHDTGEDVYVHFTGIVGRGYRDLQEGQEVSFDIVPSPKGVKAKRVMVT